MEYVNDTKMIPTENEGGATVQSTASPYSSNSTKDTNEIDQNDDESISNTINGSKYNSFSATTSSLIEKEHVSTLSSNVETKDASNTTPITNPTFNKNNNHECALYDDEGNEVHLDKVSPSVLNTWTSIKTTTVRKRNNSDIATCNDDGYKDNSECGETTKTPRSSLTSCQDTIQYSHQHTRNHNCIPTVLTNPSKNKVNESNDNNDEMREMYVRSGTKLRALFEDALDKATDGFSHAFMREHENEVSVEVVEYDRSVESVDEEMGLQKCTNDTKNRRHRFSLFKKRRKGDKGDEDDDEDDPLSFMKRKVTEKHASELAREKVAEVMALQRGLKEAEEHAAAMSHANKTLRDASAASAARMERTTEALRIAGQNAANARADADAANARASSLASQLTALKTVMEETKRSCEIIRTEHDEISSAARSVEGRLLQTESELMRMERDKNKSEEAMIKMREQMNKLEKVRKLLEEGLEEKDNELTKTKKMLLERDDIEQARVDRTHRIENELRNSRAMLVEATSAAAESESTSAVLNETIRKLQDENKTIHVKIEENLERAAKERKRLEESLSQSESLAQKLRIKATADEEEIQKLRLDLSVSEKESGQLRHRINNLERRLEEATTNTMKSSSGGGSGRLLSSANSMDVKVDYSLFPNTPGKTQYNHNNDRTNHDNVKPSISSSAGYIIPPIRLGTPKFGGNTNSTKKTPGVQRNSGSGGISLSSATSNKCCICFKGSFGIMKSCQCGNPTCDKRAHVSCLPGSVAHLSARSVSQDGTGAPISPTILCGNKD